MDVLESMIPVNFYENFSIFWDNVSSYNLFFHCLSFIIVILTWWLCKSSCNINLNEDSSEAQVINNTSLQEDSRNFDKSQLRNTLKSVEDLKNTWCDSVSGLKIMKQKVLTEEMRSKLTQEELEEEKRTEKRQLEKIFQLLQEQSEKFQVSSIEEVEDQLNLYKL